MVKVLLVNIINVWMILMMEKNKVVVEVDMVFKIGLILE